MSTTNLTNETAKRRPLWRRILRWTVRTVVVLIVGFLVWHYVNLYFAKRELQQTIAELDKTDPKWRWKDLMAEWPDVPDAENGALVVLRAHEKLPKNWDHTFFDKLSDIPPVLRPPRPYLCRLENEHHQLADTVAEASKIVAFLNGKFQTKLTADVLSTLVPHVQKTRNIAHLLQRDLWIALEKRDVVRASKSLLALFHDSRMLGKEPFMITQLVRLAIVSLTVESLERVLANCEMTEKEIHRVFRLLLDEIRHGYFQHMIKGERATFHIVYTNIADRKVFLARLTNPRAHVSILDRLGQFVAGPMIVRSNEFHLRFTTEMVNASRLPISKRYLELERLREKFYDQKGMGEIPDIAHLLTPDFFKLVAADQRIGTTLQCARAGAAAELFRLKNNRWPTSLDEMIKVKFLDEPPIDHYTAKPVKMRRTKDGLVFYSPGPDGNYKGDALDDPYHPKLDDLPTGTRLEFRLWDVDKRRQPAPKIRDLERKEVIPFP